MAITRMSVLLLGFYTGLPYDGICFDAYAFISLMTARGCRCVSHDDVCPVSIARGSGLLHDYGLDSHRPVAWMVIPVRAPCVIYAEWIGLQCDLLRISLVQEIHFNGRAFIEKVSAPAQHCPLPKALLTQNICSRGRR